MSLSTPARGTPADAAVVAEKIIVERAVTIHREPPDFSIPKNLTTFLTTHRNSQLVAALNDTRNNQHALCFFVLTCGNGPYGIVYIMPPMRTQRICSLFRAFISVNGTPPPRHLDLHLILTGDQTLVTFDNRPTITRISSAPYFPVPVLPQDSEK